MNYIVDQPGFWSTNDEDMLQAIKKGFLECHMAMWKDLGKAWRLFWIQCEKIERDFSFHPVASLRPSKFLWKLSFRVLIVGSSPLSLKIWGSLRIIFALSDSFKRATELMKTNTLAMLIAMHTKAKMKLLLRKNKTCMLHDTTCLELCFGDVEPVI